MLNLDGDLPRHLLTGRYILQNHIIPTTEIFVYPYLNQRYVPHEWLTDVLFFLIYSRLGLAGLVTLSALLMATTFTTLYNKLSNTLNLRIPILVLICWGAIVTSINWAVRPHLVSMCLLAVWLSWADDLQRGEKIQIWRFPLLMLLWSNLHGEFIAGIFVLLAHAFGWLLDYLFDRANANLNTGKNIWMTLVLSGAASLINPSGFQPWTSILGFVNNRYLMSHMLEANPPDFQNPELRLLMGLLIFSIFLLAIKKNRFSSGQGLLLAGFSAMGLIAVRNVHLYGIVAPFAMAAALVEIKRVPLLDKLESSLQQVEGQIKGITWITTFVILSGCILIFSNRVQRLYQFEEPSFPVRATDWLESHPQPGNMFNDLNWGGYLALHLWPEHLPFIDSMADTSGQITMQYEAIVTLRAGWQDTFQQYNVRWVIVPSGSALDRELKLQGWNTAYEDHTAIILTKE